MMRALASIVFLTSLLQAPARPDQSVIVEVPATSPWTDTGIVVKAGDRVEIRAWGAIRYDPAAAARPVGPAGSGKSDGACEFVVTDPKAPAHSLVVNVADGLTFDGHGVFAGTNWKGTVPLAGTTAREGRLFIGFNDRAVMCDRSGYDSWKFRNSNAGSFTAQVMVTRAH